MDSESEVEEEYGEAPDGGVGREWHLASSEDKCLVKIKSEKITVKKPESIQESIEQVMILASFFRDILKPSERDNTTQFLESEDIDIFIEIPKDKLSKEWQLTVENQKGGFYKYQQEENEEESELRQIVPKLINKETGEEITEGIKEDKDNEQE